MSFLETAKDVYDLAKKGMTIEFQEKLMELREQALELQEENQKLRMRVAELEGKTKRRDEMQFRPPYYFRIGDKIPFCPTCWENEEKAIHMRAYIGEGDSRSYCHCAVCNLTLTDRPN
jgi:hypothetical protein